MILLAALCSCASASKVLVLYDDPLIRSTHSRFLSGLHSQGHTVTIKSVTDGSLKLRDWDEWLYEKLIIFAPGAAGEGRILVADMFHLWGHHQLAISDLYDHSLANMDRKHLSMGPNTTQILEAM